MRIVTIFVFGAVVVGSVFFYLSYQMKKGDVSMLPSEDTEIDVLEQESNSFSADDYLEDRDNFISEQSETYKNENPDSDLDVEAILYQVTNRALITSALQTYSSEHQGRYPDTLEILEPKYTPEQMFPKGKIPLDYDGTPFEYFTSTDGLEYTLCYFDIELQERDCLSSEDY